MKLYEWPLSGNSFKVRLFLSLIGREFEGVAVNTGKGETRTESFLKLNPRGQIPVLIDGEVTVWDSQAILAYLARRYAPEWLPTDPEPLAEVMQWLAVAGNELLFGLARARAVKLFGRPFNLEECQSFGRRGLAVMEAHLGAREWLAAGRPTIADCACYPYVALAPQGEVPLDDYAAVRAWIARLQALPGCADMEGIERPA